MKLKLFSGKSILISLKGVVSSFLTMLTAIILIALEMFFMRNSLYGVAIFFGFLTFVWYLFFWGWISNKMWGWN